ncbi:MAG: hypothetical protein WC282_00845, partial [Bacilli bacterium]|jgi:hypothetical protein
VVEGSVLTIEGTPSLYNNLPEFVNPTISLDYNANSSPVVSHETPESFWMNGTTASSNQFLTAESMGVRQIHLSDVEIIYTSYGNAVAEFVGGTTVPLYYSSLLNTSSIDQVVQSLNAQTVDITGYLDCYNNYGDARMRCLIRSASDFESQGLSYSVSLNSGTYTNIGTYQTGNYGSKTVSGYSFEHYRGVSPDYGSSDFIELLPYVSAFGDGSYPGALYNTAAIKDIQSLEITYRTSSISGSQPVVAYGPDESRLNTYAMPLTSSYSTINIPLENTNYFKIETSQSTLFIKDITIDYSNTGSSIPFAYLGSGTGDFRINPVRYSGSLFDGATVNVPTSIVKSGNNYTVLTSKTYTYYTFSYIQSHPNYADEASQTSPADVASYFTAFGTYPANYVFKSNYASASSLFGDEARCVSYYERTDGYATAVPYKGDGSGIPQYYECDIDVDGTYTSNNRGVGRVVCWVFGFDPSKGATNYDSSMVCVYTDDHYATFQEYLNDGSFGQRFNAEMDRTNYVWGPATTLSID